MNYVSGYRNWSSTTVIPLVTQNGNPVSGGDKVKSTVTIDLNLAYTLRGGSFDGSQIYLDVNNLFDRDPTFYNGANGYDQYSGNILGRLISVGFRARF